MKPNNIYNHMLRCIGSAVLCLGALVFAACNDFLGQEPPSQLTPEGYYSTEAQLQAVANQLYQDVLPQHSNWNYGWYLTDNNTDNQMSLSPDNKFGTGLWKTSNTNNNWSWGNIRNINYQLNAVLTKYNAGQVTGTDATVRQYIGEIYFMRAYAYFDLLKRFGDLPIVTQALPDNEAILVAANKRRPRNEVSRFITSTLDTALTYLKENFDAKHTRISTDAAYLFKSRVALYEASWLTNFKGTPFVPLGTGWAGATKDYNSTYQYFFKMSVAAAEKVAEKYKAQLVTNTGSIPQSLSDPENPYFKMWGTTDMSATPEILLWRQYSHALGVNNDVEVAVQAGNIGTGFTRSLIESYLMQDGLPIYASSYTYDDSSLAKVATHRDPRLAIFLKVPGQINCFKNMSSTEDHFVEIEPKPNITSKTPETAYYTGYAIRKGGTFDKALTANGGSENALAVFRVTDAMLNYIEEQ